VDYVIDFKLRAGGGFSSVSVENVKRPEAAYNAGSFRIRENRFQRGSFRSVFFVEFEGRHYVGKVLIARGDEKEEKRRIATTAKQYSLAHEITRRFAEALRGAGLLGTAQLEFVQTFAVKLADGRRAMLEPYFHTSGFIKWNNNEDYVREEDGGGIDPLPQALSHYSFRVTQERFLFVDVQGFKMTDGGTVTYRFTDPGFHSGRGAERMEAGDFGEAGIRRFFEKHECNHICRGLGLT
jgi:hypothetical protein